LPGEPDIIPRAWPWLWRGFSSYGARYLKRHFHAVRLSKQSSAAPQAGVPTIVYLNHPSWWDPMICLALAGSRFSKLRHFAPIDAAMLDKYRFFKRLGFFGVEPGTRRGASTFLRTARAICGQPDTALWITAQGQFTDVRARPVRLMPGLSHLLRHITRATIIPLAVEYIFWDERLPEAVAHFGPPLDWSGSDQAAADICAMLERRLETAQDALAELSSRRDANNFTTLLSGSVGVGGPYDLWRRTKAWARGQKFDAAHGRADS
jgi:1-acyl-sn-glycerol-3-phosphate acyltransferase